MATTTTIIFLITTLLLTTPTQPLLFSNLQTLLSTSHTLTTRVATLRAARGDHSGAARATQIAKTINQGLSFNSIKFMLSISYDYLKNYAFTKPTSAFSFSSAISELNELVASLTELTRIDSPEQRAAWVARNYGKLFKVSRGLINRLVKVFSKDGPLKDVLEGFQKEVLDGELFKDCLELGNGDLVGLVQMLKEIATHYYSNTSSRNTDL